jgi:hypothetical protein
MAHKKFRALPKSSDYAAAESFGQAVFGAIPLRSGSKNLARQQAMPLLHGGSNDHKLTGESQIALQTEAPTPLPRPAAMEPSRLSATADVADVPTLSTRQALCIVVSWIVAALVTAIVIHRAEVTEVGTSAFKVTGLLRDVVLGYAGLCALAVALPVLFASVILSNRTVWWLSFYIPKWLARWPITIAIVILLQVPTGLSMVFTHQHVRFVTVDIFRSVRNAFTMPSNWTPIQPPPPLPLRNPRR